MGQNDSQITLEIYSEHFESFGRAKGKVYFEIWLYMKNCYIFGTSLVHIYDEKLSENAQNDCSKTLFCQMVIIWYAL